MADEDDINLNEFTELISFEDNLLTFSLLNLLNGNHQLLNDIEIQDVDELCIELNLDDFTENSIHQYVGCSDPDYDVVNDYQAYFNLLDDFSDDLKIKIYTPRKEMSRPYVPLNEQKLLCQISKWTNNLKFKSKDSMTRDKLEMCYLAITLNTYCYQFTKKRCFICLNVCGDPAIMSNDDTILFRQDACLVDRFVCHTCHQSATNIIDVLNESFRSDSNCLTELPGITLKYKNYNFDNIIETIAGQSAPVRNESIKKIVDENFPKVQKQLISFKAFFDEKVLKHVEERVQSISMLKNVSMGNVQVDVNVLFQELNFVLNSAYNLSQTLNRLRSAYNSSRTDPLWSTNYKEYAKFVTLSNGDDLVPLRPSLSPCSTIPLQRKDYVFCVNNTLINDSLKIWNLVQVVAVHIGPNQADIQSPSKKISRKNFYEIAYSFVHPVRLTSYDMVICNLHLDQSNGEAYTAGFIVEDMCEQNHYRYLVWFPSDGYRYVWHHMVRKVVMPDGVMKSLIPFSEIESKRTVTLKNMNSLYVLHGDKWELSMILTQDASLVLVEHVECKKLEWRLLSDSVMENKPTSITRST